MNVEKFAQRWVNLFTTGMILSAVVTTLMSITHFMFPNDITLYGLFGFGTQTLGFFFVSMFLYLKLPDGESVK